MNKNANLREPLVFDEIVEPLSSLDITFAMQILKEVENEGSQMDDPTDFVLAECDANGAGPVVDLDPTGKISRQVGWLNKNANLAENLIFDEVVEPLSRIDVVTAMKILKEVEEHGASMQSPTDHVIEAAEEAIANGSTPETPRQVFGQGGGGFAPPPASSQPLPPRSKREWQEEEAHPRGDSEDSKKISHAVGRLNKTVNLAEKLSYSDVKPHLEACGAEAASTILKDLEKAADRISNPTSYVIAAAKRKASGENIPSKRPRQS